MTDHLMEAAWVFIIALSAGMLLACSCGSWAR